MHVHFIAPARYLRASHEIIRHPRLKATAKTLLLWGLSLPPGGRDTITTIGERMPEGRMAVSKARGQLIEEGFLHVKRFQHPTKGTWSTRTLLSSVPLTEPAEVAEAWGAVLDDRVHNPAVGEPIAHVVGSSPEGEKNEVKTAHPTAVGGAVGLLLRLAATDRRLAVGALEALSVAPLVEQWLARDPSEGRLRAALLTGLPGRVHSPVSLIRDRLQRKMPPEPQPAAPPRARHECDTCAAPASQPGTCCACVGRLPSPVRDTAAAERARRGAALARSRMHRRTPALA